MNTNIKKLISVVAIASAGLGISNAQGVLEAARYSKTTNLGTARSTAMGGAFTALGGDLSAVYKNPAGVGVFRKSDIGITLTPTFGKSEASSEFSLNGWTNSASSSAKKNSFQIDNLGAVIAFATNNDVLRYFNVGLTFNRINNFNTASKRLVGASATSLTHVFAAQSASIPTQELNSFGSYLAYNTYLINQDGANYFSVLDYIDADGNSVTDPVSQTEAVKEYGGQNEFTISLGVNLLNKLFIGGSIGMQQIDYEFKSHYREAADLDAPSGLDFYDYNTWERNKGIGINANIGIIYKLTDMIRLGASIHTPTWYEINYDGDASISAYYNSPYDTGIGREGDFFYSYSGVTSYDYNMRTAWRADLGAAVVISNKLIVSADADFIAYRNAKYYESDNDYWGSFNIYSELNNEIRNMLYKNAWNYAIGAEYKLTKSFSLRYGYNMQSTPYKTGNETNTHRHNCGIGYSSNVFYADLSYSHSSYKNTTRTYDYNSYVSVPVKNKYMRDILKLSFGIHF